MPKTPPTIVAPLPHDPRVMMLAKSVSLTRREAFAAAAEAWAWMSVMAVEDIVKQTAPDSLDAVVGDIDGFGQAMLQAGLVGTVDGGLVLPAELRQRQQRDERGGAAATTAVVDHEDEEEKARRRKAQNAAASKVYRRKNRITNPKPKPSGNLFRTLGRVAGHEVKVIDGPHGPYAKVVGATVGGEQCHKFTAKVRDITFEAVTLTDVLTGLVEKWKSIHDRERGRFDERSAQVLVPSFADFKDAAERVLLVAKIEQEAARHADAADASARHADASATVSRPSASPEADSERKSSGDNDFPSQQPSANAHADGASSVSASSESSSSIEEDIRGEGRKAGTEPEPVRVDADNPAVRERMAKRDEGRRLAGRIAQALGLEIDIVLHRGRTNPQYLALQCREAGIDPKTGLPFNAEAPSEPAGARGDIGTTSDTMADNMPAAGSVGAHGDGPPRVFDCPADDLRDGLAKQGIPSPITRTPPAVDDHGQLLATVARA
jgi:hypothetical protein